jgi:hypothetical protein
MIAPAARRVRMCWACAKESRFLYGPIQNESPKLYGCRCDVCQIPWAACSADWFETPPPSSGQLAEIGPTGVRPDIDGAFRIIASALRSLAFLCRHKHPAMTNAGEQRP